MGADTFREFAKLLSHESYRIATEAKKEGGIGGLVSIGVAEAVMQVADTAIAQAAAMEARTGDAQ